MKKFIVISVFLSLITFQVKAQVLDHKVHNGSVYSKIGVGYPVDYGSSSADGMGAFGVSFTESNVAGLANPAVWGTTVYTLATGGLSLQKFNASDYAGTASNTLVSVNHFQLQFPIKKNKLGVSIALTPLTRSNYTLYDTETRTLQNAPPLTASVINDGSGGVNSLELGVGYSINSYISLGYAASLAIASMNREIATVFDDSDYQGVGYTIKTSGTGFGNRFGALFTLPHIFSDQDYFRIGAAASLPLKIGLKQIQQSQKQVGTNTTETIESDLGRGDLRLPLKLSGGITYQPFPALSLTTEGLYEPWSDFVYALDSQQEQNMTDRYKAAFGIRYFPFVTGSNKFLSGFKYRAGVSYDAGYLKIGSQRIETLLFSAGLGIPAPSSNSSVDISFHYGIRGTKAENLVKESIWGVKLSVNLAELMFFRPKLQ